MHRSYKGKTSINETKYDLVDLQDNFVRVGTKNNVMNLKLYKRSVHILLINNKGDILVCKRSASKENYPNQITSSAGGKVERGESYKAAAIRELNEELGVVTPLKEAGSFNIINRRERTLHRLFIGKAKKVTLDPSEIASCYYMSYKDIARDISLHPRKYCKPFHKAFESYMKYKGLLNKN